MLKAIFSQVNREATKRDARHLLHALRHRNAPALRRYHSVDPFADLSEPRLADAKYIVAREHGYSSGRNLETHSRLTDDSTTCS